MSSNPSSLKSKAEITAALMKLMEKYPYREITVKQIVLETALVRKTFYRNFTSKDDVLNSYIECLLQEYVNAIAKSDADILAVIFDFCVQYKSFFELLHRNNMLYLLLLKLNIFIPAAHERINTPNSGFSLCFGELTPDYLIAFNTGAIYNVIAKWVERGMTDEVDTIKSTLEGYFKRGILSAEKQN